MKIRINKSISFLMEFIIVLCFFSVAAIICISIYANSYHMNEEANQGKLALTFAQNYIETKTNQFPIQESFYLDKSFKVSNTNKAFLVKVKQQEKDIFTITIYDQKEKLVSLPFSYLKGDANYE